MKILIVDDQPYNVAAAHLTLNGFDYKVVDTIKAAHEILAGSQKFDVLLTDLWLPRGEFTGSMDEGDTKDTVVAAGLIFALKAVNKGMKVVICTDSNHHKDRLCSLLDLLNTGSCEEKTVHFVEARTCVVKGIWENGQIVLDHLYYTKPGPGIKNWFNAMKRAGLTT